MKKLKLGRPKLPKKDRRLQWTVNVSPKTAFKIERYAIENKLSRGLAIDKLIGAK